MYLLCACACVCARVCVHYSAWPHRRPHPQAEKEEREKERQPKTRDYAKEQAEAIERTRRREEEGNIRQCNEGKWAFAFDETGRLGNITLDVDVPRHLDSRLALPARLAPPRPLLFMKKCPLFSPFSDAPASGLPCFCDKKKSMLSFFSNAPATGLPCYCADARTFGRQRAWELPLVLVICSLF